jgi:hypothetical protein
MIDSPHFFNELNNDELMMEFVNEKRKQNNKELISDAAFLAE